MMERLEIPSTADMALASRRGAYTLSSPAETPTIDGAIAARAPIPKVVISGGLAGCIADCIMHPLDTVKTRMQKDGASPGTRKYNGTYQALRTIYSAEGRSGLFGGFRAAGSGSLAATTLYFASYESLKRKFIDADVNETISYFTAATVAELLASVFYVPSELVKTRMQLQGRYNNPESLSRYNYRSDMDALRSVSRGGSLFHGWGTTMGRDIPFTAAQFTLYETIRGFIIRTYGPRGSGVSEIVRCDIIPGASAGFAAGLLTTPLDVVKTYLQTQSKQHSKFHHLHSPSAPPLPTAIPIGTVAAAAVATPSLPKSSHHPYYDTAWSAYKGIYRDNGIKGLFSGAVPRATWTGCQSTIMFFLLEAFLNS
ncbi:mitochondrial carrier domain-containing protein [Fimicolochytrium jonesii]|uniref:mitochondrial carrier domain-containing protein n=1 Tax=Fimicolochytrium jonesii TaxID=1396493 RepID=UPI0022FF0997|nr:mitochondrial carrier domain-containing protein [Fimicolochytrium jonesii]KAI8815803.1 mitochondrial carrier domain-containing protein [Fimicolochytrium jonesii]